MILNRKFLILVSFIFILVCSTLLAIFISGKINFTTDSENTNEIEESYFSIDKTITAIESAIGPDRIDIQSFSGSRLINTRTQYLNNKYILRDIEYSEENNCWIIGKVISQPKESDPTGEQISRRCLAPDGYYDENHFYIEISRMEHIFVSKDKNYYHYLTFKYSGDTRNAGSPLRSLVKRLDNEELEYYYCKGQVENFYAESYFGYNEIENCLELAQEHEDLQICSYLNKLRTIEDGLYQFNDMIDYCYVNLVEIIQNDNTCKNILSEQIKEKCYNKNELVEKYPDLYNTGSKYQVIGKNKMIFNEEGTKYSPIGPVFETDFETFKVLDHPNNNQSIKEYAVDKNSVYWKGLKLEGPYPQQINLIELLSHRTLLVTENYVYYQDSILDGIDPKRVKIEKSESSHGIIVSDHNTNWYVRYSNNDIELVNEQTIIKSLNLPDDNWDKERYLEVYSAQ